MSPLAPGAVGAAGFRSVVRQVEHFDTDASGVVHFARYPSLVETALLANLERLGAGLGVLAGLGLDLVVVDLAMRYRAPARYADELTLETTVGHLGAARARIDAAVRRAADEAELATGSLVVAVVDTTSGAPCPLPPVLKDALTEAGTDVP